MRAFLTGLSAVADGGRAFLTGLSAAAEGARAILNKPFTTVGHTLQAIAAAMLIVGGVILVMKGT